MATNNIISNTVLTSTAAAVGQELTDVISAVGLDLLFAEGIEVPEGVRYVDVMTADEEMAWTQVCLGILAPITGRKEDGICPVEEEEMMELDSFRFPLKPWGDIFVLPQKKVAFLKAALSTAKGPDGTWRNILRDDLRHAIKMDIPWDVAQALMALYGELKSEVATTQIHLKVEGLRPGKLEQWEKEGSLPTQWFGGEFHSAEFVGVKSSDWVSVRTAAVMTQKVWQQYFLAVSTPVDEGQKTIRRVDDLPEIMRKAMMGGGTPTVSAKVPPAPKPKRAPVAITPPTTTPRGVSLKDAFGGEVVDED